MDREKIDQWCEWGIFSLVLALVATGALLAGAPRLIDVLFLRSITVGILVLWLVRLACNPAKRLLWPPICWFVTALFLYATYSYYHAPIEYVARQEWLKIMMYVLIFFAVINNLNGQEKSQQLLMGLIILSAMIGFFALIQFITGTQKVIFLLKPTVYAKRATGTFYNPNILAGFLELFLPIALSFVLVGRLKYVTKIVIGYCALMILVGLGVSFSRGGWVASAITLALLFVILISKRNHRLPAILALVVLGGGLWIFFQKMDFASRRLDSIIQSKNEDTRFEVWKPAVAMWKDHSMTGVGPGHFDYKFPSYRPVHLTAIPLYTHNDYLNTLCDYGNIGLVLVLGTILCFGYCVWEIFPFVQKGNADLGRKNSSKYALVLGGTLSLITILLHSFVDFNLQMPSQALAIAVICGTVMAYSRFATERYWVKPGWILKILTISTLLASAGFISFETFRAYQQIKLFERAKMEKSSTKTLVSLLKESHGWDPKNPEPAAFLAETHRQLSFLGNLDFKTHGKEAEKFFRIAVRNNPLDAKSKSGLALTLSWLNETPEQLVEANQLLMNAYNNDRFNPLISARFGWNCLQNEDVAGASFWIATSLNLDNSEKNYLAHLYEPIIKARIQEAVQKQKAAGAALP